MVVMKSYDGVAVDHYMRTILEQDLTEHETDNALTLLTTLTTLAEDDFPHEKTFIRVSKTRLKFHEEIVRVRGIQIFTTHGEENDLRGVYIPRGDLKTIKTAMTSLFEALGKGYTLKDL